RFSMEADEIATLWVRYRSQGDTALPIKIETEPSFLNFTHANTAKYFIFYAVIIVFLSMSVIAFAQHRSFKFLAYFLYASSVLVYVMHRDGFTFQYFWPNAPGFNNFASLPLACGITFFAALFTRTYLETRQKYPLADLILQVIMIAAFLMVGAVIFVNESDLKLYTYYYVAASSFTFLAIGIGAWSREGRRVLYFILGWFGIVVSSVIVTGYALIGYDIPRSATLDFIRFAMVFDASMMGMAVLDGINIIRRERDASLREKVDVLQTNLGLQDRLQALETRYTDVQRIAYDRGRVLADATHDLRQPLFSLRTSIQNTVSASKPSKEGLEQINNSFTYLESLVDEYMASALSGTENVTKALPQKPGLTPLSLIIESVAEMFSDEAQLKNIELRTVKTTQTVDVPAFVLLRMMSNLVSNAVKYTPSGKVLIGVRLRNGRPSLEVYDTGPGLAENEIEMVLKRHNRGLRQSDSPEGAGLGLNIVSELADANSMILEVSSTLGKGSVFRLRFSFAHNRCTLRQNRRHS
ncbi:MAG: sensor histidine kinase, partial [Pseudomonadota bacterium]